MCVIAAAVVVSQAAVLIQQHCLSVCDDVYVTVRQRTMHGVLCCAVLCADLV